MQQHIRDHVAEFRASYREQILGLLRELVARPTVNAGRARMDAAPGQEVPGEETRAVEVLAPYLDILGVPWQVHALDPRRANLLATLGRGGRSLCVGCHTDVVPAGDGWSSDPFRVRVEGDRLYGRGVLDNKGPLAAAWAAMKILLDAGVALDGRLILAAIASEEHREAGEPDPGLGHLLDQGLLSPDLAIIPDIGEDMRRIDIAEKGRLELRLVAVGVQAHGSTPERGVNAIHQAARFLAALERHVLDHREHPVLGRPTVNVGTVRGGSAANIVPGECEVVVDVRYVPGMSAEGVLAEMRDLARAAGGEWRVELGDVSEPHAIPADSPLVGAIQRAAEPVLGFRPEPFGMGGGTFAKTFNLGGIPAVGWGPGDDEAFHVADEWVDLEQLVQFAEVLALVAVDVLGTR